MQLLSPLRIGNITVPNRVFMAPLTRIRADEQHVPTDLIAEHYRQRASGGLLISEATMVDGQNRAFGLEPGIYSDAHAAGWRKVVDAVHAAGGHMALQLWHPGRATHHDLNGGRQPISSSNKPIRNATIHTPSGKQPYPAPRALRTEEIPGVVELFRSGAARAKAVGFDFVEVHGAHGYLIDQFLRDGVNDRADRYGGSLENRARLLFEVVDAAIGELGAARVGVRISPLAPGNDMHDSQPAALVEHVARGLQQRGVAFLHLRAVKHEAPEEVELARIARRAFSGVIIRNGGYTRASAEADVRDGLADAIAFGMKFIANPDLPARFAQNAPLNEVDMSTLYAPGPKGYTDYPALAR